MTSNQQPTVVDEGAEALDPVCGMQVDPRLAFSAAHDGFTYSFCSKTCRDKFLREPDRYCVSCIEVK